MTSCLSCSVYTIYDSTDKAPSKHCISSISMGMVIGVASLSQLKISGTASIYIGEQLGVKLE